MKAKYKNNDLIEYRNYSKNRSFSMIEYECEEQIEMQPHWHNSIEIIYVLRGTAIVWQEEFFFELNQNDIIYISSNLIHSIRLSKFTRIISLQISSIWIHEVIPDFLKYNVFLCSSTLTSPNKKLKYQYFIQQFLLLKDIFYSSEEAKEIGVNGYIFLLLYLLINQFQITFNEVEENRFKYQYRIKKISEFVNNHYHEHIKLEELANELSVTSQYLSKIFRKYYDISFKDYLSKVRLEHAIYEMITTNQTLLEISEKCGFPSQHAFIYTFKRFYQLTPSQYKEKMKI